MDILKFERPDDKTPRPPLKAIIDIKDRQKIIVQDVRHIIEGNQTISVQSANGERIIIPINELSHIKVINI